MSYLETDTIFALSSAIGRAGVSVMRLSGPDAGRALQRLIKKPLPKPRMAALRPIYNVEGAQIDAPLVIWFPSPKSFTGQDCAEIHLHGSIAVIEAAASALLALGLRQALPGEFTRRAVENGKMDLTEAEGLADLIDAETEGQRAQAILQMEGGLRQNYETWQSLLLDAMAQIEGEIDFADEADVPDGLSSAAYPYLKSCRDEMASALSDVDRGRAIRRGIEIAIIGAPNAGKSTLMNALAKRDVVITSPEAGTTRDIVETNLRLGGFLVTLLDTAGLRETDNSIEAEGVKRAKERSSISDIRVLVHRPDLKNLEPFPTQLMQAKDIIYINKTIAYETNLDIVPHKLPPENIIDGNALTGAGVDELLRRLEAIVTAKFSHQTESGLTRARHKDCVNRAHNAVTEAITTLDGAPELVSENIRLALSALEELSGRSNIEQVFDRIFSRFCIGK